MAAAQNSTFSAEATVDKIHAVVKTKNGEPVRGLGIKDFTIDESGERRTILHFSQDGDSPLTIGLLIDTRASQRRLVEHERHASHRFLEDLSALALGATKVKTVRS